MIMTIYWRNTLMCSLIMGKNSGKFVIQKIDPCFNKTR